MRKYIIILLVSLIANTFGNAYASLTYFQIIVTPININFHLEDAKGNISGYIPEGIADEIPNMGFYMKSGEPGESFSSHKIEQNGSDNLISPGKYKLVLYGSTKIEQAKIGIDLGYSENSMGAGAMLVEYVLPNTIGIYEFDVPSMPPINNITLIKVSTPNDLITDINALVKENYIGDSKFVTEVINKIQEIEKKRVKPATKDDKLTSAQKAKKEYQEMIKELYEKYQKPDKNGYVDGLAFSILQRDLDYIINHIQ